MGSTLRIADYIIGKSKQLLTPMQVNKLAYISHGFTLAIRNEPLFPDKVQAWKYGPIIPSIYHEFKDYGGGLITAFKYCGTALNDTKAAKDRLAFLESRIPKSHISIINEVLEKYGHFSGLGLSTITHEDGTPWDQRYHAGKLGVEIPNSLTKKYYKEQLQ